MCFLLGVRRPCSLVHHEILVPVCSVSAVLVETLCNFTADLSNSIYIVHGYEKDGYTFYLVIIVGAGRSAIAMGWQIEGGAGI